MNLYELKEEWKKAMDGCQIDEETGEMIGWELVDELKGAFEEKLENCGCYYKGLTAEANAIKEEEKALKERRERIENRAEKFLNYIDKCMKDVEQDKLETPRICIKYRKSESVNVLDESLIPVEYIKEKVETSPDKTAIKKAIKSGVTIPGAEVVTNFNLKVE